MATTVLSDGMQYTIPNSDFPFFKVIAEKMGWIGTKIGNVANSKQSDTSADSVGGQYTLSKSKGRFTPKYESKKDLMNGYLSEKYGI
ncbi:MAG: hypothetical protein J6K41_05870 [Paraprevotella sp.]|nr:hypothetical protein [Paraprevotella sp.]